MGKRLADAASRTFFDQYESVKVSRFRAMGVIDPAKREALIQFPNGKTKLIGTAHTRLKYGGGWSFFLCPKCAKLARTLYLIDDAPLCCTCCDKLNIKRAGQYGFGRAERRQAKDKILDELIAKLETTEPLRFKGAPESWQGKAKLVYRSRRLTERMRRSMISLRLNQLASQQARDNNAHLKLVRAYEPRRDALAAIPEAQQVWKARTHESLEQALDKAQVAILNALESEEPAKRLAAARIMLRTKQARERGFTGICT